MDADSLVGWRDLFLALIGVGATLAGLTFIAIALSPRAIAQSRLLRYRAPLALSCFVSMIGVGVTVITPRPYGRILAVTLALLSTWAVLRAVRAEVLLRRRLRGGPLVRFVVITIASAAQGIGGFALALVLQGWVFFLLAATTLTFFGVGIFTSWLLVLQIDIPEPKSEGTADRSR